MKFFPILLLASLASTCLAVLNAAEFIPSSHPRNDLVSSEDLAEETAISREAPVSIKEAVIESIRRLKNQTPELLHPTAQEDSFRNAALQSEEMIELTPGAATTLEEKLANLDHKIRKNLDKVVKETMNYLKSLFSRASEVMRP